MLSPIIGLSFSFASVLSTVGVMVLLSFGLTSLGLAIAVAHGFDTGISCSDESYPHPDLVAIRAFFPVAGVSPLLEWVMKINPLTYGVAALRRCLHLNNPSAVGEIPQLTLSLVVTGLFCIVMYFGAAQKRIVA